MAEIKVLVWKTSEALGEPDVEVKVPASLARWIPKMMAFVPKKAKSEVWGEDTDFSALFTNLEQLVNEAVQGGSKEIADVRTKESHVKILVER